MNILKYIINEENIPIIFSETISHQDILQKGITAGYLILNYEVESNTFYVKCFGQSTTMNLKPSDRDEAIITDYLNSQFINTMPSSELLGFDFV
jgi:hypothetical protein